MVVSPCRAAEKVAAVPGPHSVELDVAEAPVARDKTAEVGDVLPPRRLGEVDYRAAPDRLERMSRRLREGEAGEVAARTPGRAFRRLGGGCEDVLLVGEERFSRKPAERHCPQSRD